MTGVPGIAPRRMDPATRYRTMSAIKKTGTRPELALMKAAAEVFSGQEVLFHARTLRGTPDVYVPRLGLVIFCDGCLFHGCPRHCRIPRRNTSYWGAKISRNQARDATVRRALRAQGLSVWRVWEHSCVGPSSVNLYQRLLGIKDRVGRGHLNRVLVTAQ